MKSSKCPSKNGQQRSPLFWLVAGLGFFAARDAFAAEYYVATTGSDSNPGTKDSPFATLTKGAGAAGAGDTVYIRGGTYNPSGGFTFSKSGTSDTNRIKYWAYPGEVPVFDFSKASGHPNGFSVTGSWLHFKGIEICNLTEDTSAINAIVISNASNDIMELMNTHHNAGSGIFISHGSGGHLFLNCDSHDNYDPTSAQGDGQNADGFGVHYQAAGDGTSTTIRGCRSWWNSDDGYDFINQEFPVTIENSWAFGSGFANYGTTRPADGNGNGFKIGSSKTGIRHLVQNNVAWGCKASGFYANHSSGGNTWYNNTSFQNGTQFNMLASTWSAPNGGGTRTDGVTLSGDKAHIMRNNIAFPNKNEYVDGYGVDTQFNTWDLNITPAAKDFLSIADASVSGTGAAIETTSIALGPRQADGSLPNVDFMKLAAGSQMIDKGKDVGLPFVGAAPDLGAYEFGATGAAGASGSGGVTATGGATATAGTPGSGGVVGTGGATGAGGKISTGGSTSAGGATKTGGAPASGGTLASGGTTVMGGRPGTGGTSSVVASGGAVSSGGATVGSGGVIVETGGAVATGGVMETGGSPETGGNSNPGPAATGGTVAAAGGTSAGTTAQDTASSGCSCRLAGTETAGRPGFALLALLMFALRLRKRR
jgi:MYXO-CTERM domain-containing protein